MTTTATITKLPDSEIEIKAEVPSTDFMRYWRDAVAAFGKNMKIDGFRPGQAPEKIVVERVGEMAILHEMAELAIGKAYPEVIIEHKLEVVGEPEIAITKIAKDNPLCFTLKTAVMPEIKLDGHEKIAKDTAGKFPLDEAVTDDEVEKVIADILKSRAKEGGAAPELTLELVKELGNFDSIEAFKQQIKENITAEKKHRARDKRRLAIIDAIAEKAKIELSPVLIRRETERMLSELKGQIERMGLKFTDYLSHLKKTEDELKETWHPEARKRVEFGLIVNAIAKKEGIIPTDEMVNKEVDHLLAHNPDLATTASPERIRAYVANIIANDMVMDRLDPAN